MRPPSANQSVALASVVVLAVGLDHCDERSSARAGAGTHRQDLAWKESLPPVLARIGGHVDDAVESTTRRITIAGMTMPACSTTIAPRVAGTWNTGPAVRPGLDHAMH